MFRDVSNARPFYKMNNSIYLHDFKKQKEKRRLIITRIREKKQNLRNEGEG